MDLEELAQLATVIAAVLILPQIFIAVIAMLRSHRREKLKSTIDYFEQIDKEIKEKRGDLANRYGDRLTQDDVVKIYENKTEIRNVNSVLNAYERLSLATNMGVLDYSAVKRLSGDLLRKNFKRYKEYIVHRREKYNAKNAWVEFQTLAKRLEDDRTNSANKAN